MFGSYFGGQFWSFWELVLDQFLVMCGVRFGVSLGPSLAPCGGSVLVRFESFGVPIVGPLWGIMWTYVGADLDGAMGAGWARVGDPNQPNTDQTELRNGTPWMLKNSTRSRWGGGDDRFRKGDSIGHRCVPHFACNRLAHNQGRDQPINCVAFLCHVVTLGV